MALRRRGIRLRRAPCRSPAMPSTLLAKDKPTVTAKATQAGPSDDRPIQSIVALVNDEPITGYEIEQRVALAMLGATDVQRKLQAKLKSPSMNEQFKNFAMKRLKANPPKSEAEQQARVKQLQGEFVASLKSQIEKEYVPTARKQALDEIIDERLKMQEAKRLSDRRRRRRSRTRHHGHGRAQQDDGRLSSPST